MTDAAWWTTAFGADYLAVYAHRDDAAAAAEVAGLAPRLRAAVARHPGPVLDAGCGGGRHLDALRRLGLPALGFDLSPELLAVANRRPGCAGRVLRADLRAVPLAPGSCAAVVVLFTAFGYFDDAANAACLAGLVRLLAPGGELVLDLPDAGQVAAGLVPESRRTLADGTLVEERRALRGPRVEKEVVLRRPDGAVRAWRESVRLYAPSEVAALAAAAGAACTEIWPSLQGPAERQGRMVCWLRA